jgi:hypothetical protein
MNHPCLARQRGEVVPFFRSPTSLGEGSGVRVHEFDD